MGRLVAVLYGIAVYLLFFLTFLCAIGFVGNIAVPKSIDSGGGEFSLSSLIIDALLLVALATQQSVVASAWFKRTWTKVVPWPVERSTDVLLGSLCLILISWQWRPMTQAVWNVHTATARAILVGLFWIGWLIALASTFRLDHFDLFGLRQVTGYLRGVPYQPLAFGTPMFYRYVRHPIYLGLLLAFWATPSMSQGHLLFAIATTAYMMLAIQFEEQDLLSFLGDAYRQYKQRTPMLIPFSKR